MKKLRRFSILSVILFSLFLLFIFAFSSVSAARSQAAPPGDVSEGGGEVVASDVVANQSQVTAALQRSDDAAEDLIRRAWERVKESGSYSFDADITQIQRPVLSVMSVGKPTKRDDLYLEGVTNLVDQSLEMTLWTQGGSVQDKSSGAQIRIDGDAAYARQGDQPWQEINNFTGLFAPNNDFLAYLVAAVNVQNQGLDSRAGIEFTRLIFDIDGLAYAHYMRDQVQADMLRRGELVQGMEVAMPAMYRDMTGHGELWLDADGLPLRQLLQLDFAPEGDQQVSAEVSVSFRDYAPVVVVAATSNSPAAAALDYLAPILPSTVTPEQIVETTNQFAINGAPLLIVLLLVGLFLRTLLYSGRSRTILAALQLTLIGTMLITPLLRGANAQQAFGRRQDRVAASEARSQENEMTAALQSWQAGETRAVSPGTITDILNDTGLDSDSDGYTDVQENFLGTNPKSDLTLGKMLPSLVPAFDTPAEPLPVDNGDDSDGDGLTDYVEALLGTGYDYKGSEDTDGDGIPDDVEVLGFTDTNGVKWVTDPLEMDTNRDGVGDGQEWTVGAVGGIPADSDGDDVPDLFDDDDDGDDVPDKYDLSPSTFVDKTFDGNNPFGLVVSGLEANKITYVEFQLRPTDATHLQYTYNALDWPDDIQGNFQDGNQSTDDVRLIPMLELIVPDAASNLLPMDTLPKYNIMAKPLPGDDQAVYVPLNVVTENKGSGAVAFSGKMVYNGATDWDVVQQVRLVWLVQAQNDVCDTFDDARLCSHYSSYDTPQVIHTYEDTWQLTGLNVRENHWTDIATVYEDLAEDDDPNDDTALWQLSHGLDLSFMAGGVVTGTQGTRLWDVDEIANRFDHTSNSGVSVDLRWNISDTLSVATASYSHLDEALITTAQTTTLGILNSQFSPQWTAADPISPTLLFARQDKYRSFNLDEAAGTLATWGQTAQNANELTVNIPQSVLRPEIASTVSWAPYLYDDLASQWESFPIELYWEYLGEKIAADMLAEFVDPEVAGGATLLAQIYYMALVNGVHNIMQVGEQRLEQEFFGQDRPIGFSIALGGRVGVVFLVKYLIEKQNLESTVMLRLLFAQIRDETKFAAANPAGTAKLAAGRALTSMVNKLRSFGLSSTMAKGAVFLVVAAIAVGIGLLVAHALGEGAGGPARIAVATVVGAVTFYLGVVGPVMQMRALAAAFRGAYSGVTTANAAITKAALSAESVSKGAKIAAGVGLVIAVGISWVMFAYIVGSSNIAPGSVAFNTFLAQTIAATIIAVIQFALSFTIVGAIIVAIFGIIDLLLFILGVDFSLNGWFTETLGKFLYHFELTVDADIDTGEPVLTLADPNRGMAEGAIMAASMAITTSITHNDPDDFWGWRVLPYLPAYYTTSNMRSSTFSYNLTPTESPFDSDRDDMRNQWRSLSVDHRYAAWKMYEATNYVQPSTNVALEAGINEALSLYLNNSYALPGVECWTIPQPLIWPYVVPICIDKTIDGSGSSDIGSSLILDVLPATLDEFLALDWGKNLSFPVQADYDNDGLTTRELNGNDPDDFDWDSDDDGLSDAYEIVRRGEGVLFDPGNLDSDFDGLSDADEIQFGTDPGFQDTDRDGLKDSEEVWHFDTISQTWTGGWDYTVIYTDANNGPDQTLTVRIFSDPLNSDIDEDGLSDGVEKALHLIDPVAYPYNPNAFNESPIALYLTFSDDDRYVTPNQTLTISATVRNNLATALYAKGNYTLTLPDELGGAVQTQEFDILQDLTDSIVTQATITANQSGPITITASSFTRLHDGDLNWSYQWLPAVPPQPRTTASTVTSGDHIYYATIAPIPGPASNPYKYAIAALEGPSSLNYNYASANTLGNGVATARPGSLEILSPNQTSWNNNADVYHTIGKVGNYEPDIACNELGDCAEAYVGTRWQGCADVYFSYMHVYKEDDAGSNGEYGLYHNYASGADRVRFWGWRSGGNGDDLSITETRYMCTGDTITAYEEDPSPNANDRLGSHTPDLTGPHSASHRYKNGDDVEVFYTVRPNPDHLGFLRLLDDQLTFDGSHKNFSALGDGAGGFRGRVQNPAVATSGNRWLAGFESSGLFTKGELYVFSVNNNGTDNNTSRLDTDHTFWGYKDRNLDLAWNGNHFLAVWERDYSVTDHDIYMALIDANGNVTSRKTVDTAGSNERQPAVAYSAELNQVLLVYVSGNKLVGRFIQGNNIGTRYDIASLAGSETSIEEPRVSYDETNNIWMVSWVGKNSTSLTRTGHYIPLAPSTLHGGMTSLKTAQSFSLGYYGTHDLACANPDVAIDPNFRQTTNCAIVSGTGRLGGTSMSLRTVLLESIPPWIGGGGGIDNNAAETLTIDDDPPVSSITSLSDGETLVVTDTLRIGGEAFDPTATSEGGVVRVQVNIDGSGWMTATGTNSWAYEWNVPNTDGPHTIQVMAKDIVGHDETPAEAITFYLDRSAPTTTIDQAANQFMTATQDESGRYHLAFSGTAIDTNGVTSVAANVSPSGNGWQTATLSNDSWTLDYVLAEFDENGAKITNPTGHFTLTVQATDGLGNAGDAASYSRLPFRLDTTPPQASLNYLGPNSTLISDTITLTGAITDPGSIASGIQQLEIDFVPLGQVSDTWRAVTLGASGSGVANTTWSYPIPGGEEGNYQINLRGTDVQGNQTSVGNWFSNWQGEIDTLAPRADLTVTLVYVGNAAKTKIEASIYDRNLTEDGFEFLCGVRRADRGMETDTLPDGIAAGQDRLTSLNVDCMKRGHITDTLTLRVFDLYGHETIVAATADSINTNLTGAPLMSEALASAQADTQVMAPAAAPMALAPPALAGTVLTPSHESAIIDISSPITITGGAYAISGLKALTLTVSGTVQYATSWVISPTVTDTLWQTTWTPPADGVYELRTTVEDWAGAVQTDLYPVTVIVDTSPPTVTLATNVLTDSHRLSIGRFELMGTAVDDQGLEAVTVAIDGGPVFDADLNDPEWRYVWTPLVDPDGQNYSAVITAYDSGNETTINTTLTVDVLGPQNMTVTTGYVAGGAPVAISNGDTVTNTAVTDLATSWTPASDGSGIAEYLVGWTNSPIPTLAALTSYADANTAHTTAVSEATLWFGHAAAIDNLGNSSIQTIGPVYIDAPTTPDYINPADGLGGIYRGWMNSGCSLIGADYEVARYAPDNSSLSGVQKFYATWDANYLRLAWTGADWRVDGDLFIYLDTTGGGATQAYNPYNGAGASINLPNEGSGQMGADYLIFVEDGDNATLFSWVSGNWDGGQSLTAPNFFFDPNSGEEKTDLYIPFNSLGSPASLKLVALASEEESLRLWAAMPDHNPLNSQRAVNPAAINTLDLPFALTQQYEWANVGSSGVCPATGQFENADLHFELTAEPAGVSVGFLGHDLPGLTLPNSALDANLDGVPDMPLPLDVNPVPVGRDKVITYTLHYANNGPADASNVVADIAAAGGLVNLSTASISLGTIAAGSSGSASFTAVIDPDVDGESAEIRVQVVDAAHAPFDWLWQQHDIDSVGPISVTILSPVTYMSPFTTTFKGVATDVSGIPQITLKVNGTPIQPCVDPTPYDGEWTCQWNANDAADGQQFTVAAMGTDEWNNTGDYGPEVTFVVDRGLPAISLNAATLAALNDNQLTLDETTLGGSVTDDRAADGAEICALASGQSEPTCTEVPVSPSGQATASWLADAPIPGSADGESYTLSFYGIDSAGNRSATPTTHVVTADFIGPDIQITTQPEVVAQFSTGVALAGTIDDGSDVDSLTMRIVLPDNGDGLQNETQTISLGNGPNWSRSMTFSRAGDYRFSLIGVDDFGNETTLGQYPLRVVDAGVNLPPIADSGGPYEVNEGETVTLNGAVADPNGDALTFAWDLDDDTVFETTGVLNPTFDATNIDGPAQRTVRLRVTDGLLETTVSTIVNIRNQAPSADAGGSYTVAEGGQLTLFGSGTDPYAGDTVTYAWDLDGDDIFDDATGATAVFNATNLDGPTASSVSIRVTDDDGDFSIATADVTVTNVNPTLSIITVTPINENGVATLTGNLADASVLDSFELVVDWGDGSGAIGYVYPAGTTNITETHQYLDDNPSGTATDTYDVTMTLVDDDDGSTANSAAAVVSNLNPTLSNVAVTNIDENGVATLTGNLADVGTLDSFAMDVDWGDGSTVSTYTYPAGTTVFTETHHYLDDNPSGTPSDPYIVGLTLTDDDTGTDVDSIIVTVSNLNPTLSNIAITNVNENGVAILTGNTADIGTQDSFTLTVSWGDLSATSTYTYPAGTAAFTETHQYLDDNPSGTPSDQYTVDLTLTDDDTGTDVDSVTVTVSNLNPTLSNVAITDVDENGVAILTGNTADIGTQDSFTLTVSWGDLSATSTYTYPAGTTAFTETHQYLDDNPSSTPVDDYIVALTLTDDDTGTDGDSVTVTVTNLNPTLSNVAITDVFEDGISILTGNMADVGTMDTFTMTVDWGDLSATSTYTYPAGTTAFTETHRYLDDNPSGTFSDPYTVSLILTDDDSGSTTDSTVVTVTNVNPVLSADVSTQDVQYSDLMANVTITGTDVAGDPLQASTSWNVNGNPFAAGLPSGMSLATNSCTFVDNLRTCTWTLSGIADVPAGTYLLRITVDDDDLGQSSILRTMTVTPEDSVVTFDGDNPVAVQVTEPESNASLPFEMVVYIEELETDQAAYGAAPGDISLAEVSMTLQPVGPGSPVTVACTPVLIDAADNYDDVLQATCSFADVPVNTYSVDVTVDGGYYAGYSEDVLVVYDPSLGFTTGGGWFYWPGTEDEATGYPGDKTNFGYSMSYNKRNLKNVKGSLLLIRHLADGTKYRVKSNALEGLSIGDAGLFGWASFSGKATFLRPGWLEPVGNHTFLAYVEDHDEPGNGIDEFWLETRDKDGEVILDLSMARPGSANAEQIRGGNIVVPHSGVDDGNLPPTADFSTTTNGLDATFSDLSDDPDGSVISWSWDFGDGNSSTAENPSHTYAAGGTYNVTLTVTDDEGASDSASQQVTVSGANQPPVTEFSYTTSALSASFTDLSDDPDGTILSWSWDFGDGATSSVQNPSHTFPSSGTYDVLLTATDNDGASDTFGQQVTVSDGSGGAEMYIADLTGASTPDGGGSWNATVTILVLDDAGDPVVNADVSGTWSKGFYASSSCTTDANGECTVEQTGIGNKTRRVTFTVDSVTHSAFSYNPALNAVSSVRVNRP